MIYIIVSIIVVYFYYKYKPCLNTLDGGNAGLHLNWRAKFCIIVSVFVTLLLILRHDYFGTDTQNYHHLFDNIERFYTPVSSLSEVDLSSEYGFFSLVYYLKIHGAGFRMLIAISAISYVSCVSYLIYKYSENILFSYFIFLMYGFFVFNTTMRQCFALTFIILAVICAIKRRILLYFIFLFLAILFHATAIVCIPIYYVINMRLNKKSILFFLLLIIIVSLMASTIFYSMQDLTGKTYENSETTGYIRTAIMVILLLIGIANRKKLSKENEYWMKMFFMALCLQPIAQLNPALFRVNYYFYFFTIIFAPNIVQISKSIKPLLTAFLIAYGAYNFTLGSSKAGVRVVPYVYFWENYFEENPNVKFSDFDY